MQFRQAQKSRSSALQRYFTNVNTKGARFIGEPQYRQYKHTLWVRLCKLHPKRLYWIRHHFVVEIYFALWTVFFFISWWFGWSGLMLGIMLTMIVSSFYFLFILDLVQVKNCLFQLPFQLKFLQLFGFVVSYANIPLDGWDLAHANRHFSPEIGRALKGLVGWLVTYAALLASLSECFFMRQKVRIFYVLGVCIILFAEFTTTYFRGKEWGYMHFFGQKLDVTTAYLATVGNLLLLYTYDFIMQCYRPGHSVANRIWILMSDETVADFESGRHGYYDGQITIYNLKRPPRIVPLSDDQTRNLPRDSTEGDALYSGRTTQVSDVYDTPMDPVSNALHEAGTEWHKEMHPTDRDKTSATLRNLIPNSPNENAFLSEQTEKDEFV